MTVDEVRAALRADLVGAMKARDAVHVAAVRTAIAAIDNAESVDIEGITATEVPRRELSDTEVQAILAQHVHDYGAEADGYDAVGQAEAAERLRRQAALLRRHL
ncbi:hypothetical protein BVC93_22355 [Mycobacterium sp. MS1601]|uniref:GatB/YqeY domain-containing protein n=1 Tax=Mycobacterium sp. MS1601 TaxID=1936029 RepID=UPI0009790666|nr:GatB/YqeY domain-containing protein [Mycobacterium sp. MS1601]AQA04708.1 hypothetical protein BVC93_22355 [Mycobacterium sp. MS1601]